MPLPAAYTTRRRWTAAEARVVLAALVKSWLSVPAFAIREGLDAQRIRRWQHQLEAVAGAGTALTVAKPPKFVELRPSAPERVEVVLRSGHVLRVAESIDPSALVRLVNALEQSSC